MPHVNSLGLTKPDDLVVNLLISSPKYANELIRAKKVIHKHEVMRMSQ
jgi:hypothetical protein